MNIFKRRRDAYAAEATRAPIKVEWAMPEQEITRPGFCPKCGEHFGRAVRGHSKDCPPAIDPEVKGY